ncbi:MAG: pyrroline-5-carboxylate reductase [Rubrivivax sp.]|nr:pyrroline-5-carboxylate reductase [Rubrivivax sp.]
MNPNATTAFIGGGNMAGAILGGLIRSGASPRQFVVIEPQASQREKLLGELGIHAQPQPDAALQACSLVVWAVKPQSFAEAASACAGQAAHALQLSIMAGVRAQRIAAATGSPRVVRAMPNTPALIGLGITGLWAGESVSAPERRQAEQVLAATGSTLWVGAEGDLDAVTALSGSGPAYVFYFIEAMLQAGTEMGLAPEAARRLAQETFAGAAALAMASDDPPQLLRERVTSRGGTTFAALSSLETSGVKDAFVRALHAARERSQELGRG